MNEKERIRVLTWHVHGSYLYYLSQGNYDIFLPTAKEKTAGYLGKGETFRFGENVIEVEASEVKNMDFDLILYQDDDNYFVHQYEILSEEQRKLPKIYLEHDPPWGHPTNTKHPITDPDVLIVHVTHFNRLMWDNGSLRTKVVEHGVKISPIEYKGDKERGAVVINNLPDRGRMLGFDLFTEISKELPLDLIGMGSEPYGIGEVLHPDLPEFLSHYRFFFNPIRYTSLGLAVLEAMMMGIPVVALATTELAVTIKDGYNGFIHTDPAYLKEKIRLLLQNPSLAREIGENGRQTAMERYNITRFVQDWEDVFNEAIYLSKTKEQDYEKNSVH